MKAASRIIKGINNMSSIAHKICILGMLFSIVCLAGALCILFSTGGFTAETYQQYILVKELYYLPVALLLVTAALAAVAEEYIGKKK